jgi:hypothetical protein
MEKSPFMEIELLLDLDIRKLSETEEALEILQQQWRLANEPTNGDGLVRILKRTMDACQQKGIRYPRVFLLRKGQRLRKKFKPRMYSSSERVKFTAPSHPNVPQEWIAAAAEDFEKKFDERMKRPTESFAAIQ